MASDQLFILVDLVNHIQTSVLVNSLEPPHYFHHILVSRQAIKKEENNYPSVFHSQYISQERVGSKIYMLSTVYTVLYVHCLFKLKLGSRTKNIHTSQISCTAFVFLKAFRQLQYIKPIRQVFSIRARCMIHHWVAIQEHRVDIVHQ